MRGSLIVNGFLNTNKFREIYDMLAYSANALGVELDIVKGSSIVCDADNIIMETKPDFIIFWDKDVHLASRLERLNIPLFNSSRAIELCDNKILTARCLADNGIRHPRTIIAPLTFENVGYTDLSFVENAGTYTGYPMIIKEAYGSFGQQVYLADNVDEAKAIANSMRGKQFIMQEFIKTSCGRDVRVNVVGDKVIASMLRYNDDDFRSNISNGGSMMPYTINEKQAELAINATRAMGLDFAGVDVLFGENNEPIICEVNSNPHFMSTLMCTHINLADYIIKYIVGKLS